MFFSHFTGDMPFPLALAPGRDLRRALRRGDRRDLHPAVGAVPGAGHVRPRPVGGEPHLPDPVRLRRGAVGAGANGPSSFGATTPSTTSPSWSAVGAVALVGLVARSRMGQGAGGGGRLAHRGGEHRHRRAAGPGRGVLPQHRPGGDRRRDHPAAVRDDHVDVVHVPHLADLGGGGGGRRAQFGQRPRPRRRALHRAALAHARRARWRSGWSSASASAPSSSPRSPTASTVSSAAWPRRAARRRGRCPDRRRVPVRDALPPAPEPDAVRRRRGPRDAVDHAARARRGRTSPWPSGGWWPSTTVNLAAGGRPGHRPHRAQRRREDHAVQRRLAARSAAPAGGSSSSGAGHRLRGAPTGGPPPASAAPSSAWSCSGA